ncbi:hypothetical protein [Hymenobacter sp. BT559]|uniref:hypothetical protein n=1 Tax=Hymenobacter sp. BT559 TaxID=2795729 RepID=UPI0018ED3120|nr:hypothetical protein [Hymenobacter sp. BT559]MBJ6143095.1 hypothetical protein [Hymenobacter sp. BT559]
MSQNEHSRTQADVANDGTNASRPENANGVGAQQQGSAPLTTDGTTGTSEGTHGGSGAQPARDAKGSSHRGDEPNADSKNTGGGSDQEHKNQTKNTTDEKTDYGTGNAAPSAANDGGKIDDANNPA